MEQRPTILAMFSGGLDSLGMLYKLLTEEQYKDYDIHVHHVHNRNIENRHRAEAIAVNIALKELKNLGFKFAYSESEIATVAFGRHFLYDTDTMNFFAGYIASVNPDIKKIAVGMQSTDTNETLSERRIRATKILTAFTEAEKIYPVMEMSKREIYDMLPNTLKNVFWSCRRPVYKDKQIIPCGVCETCVKLKEQGIR